MLWIACCAVVCCSGGCLQDDFSITLDEQRIPTGSQQRLQQPREALSSQPPLGQSASGPRPTSMPGLGPATGQPAVPGLGGPAPSRPTYGNGGKRQGPHEHEGMRDHDSGINLHDAGVNCCCKSHCCHAGLIPMEGCFCRFQCDDCVQAAPHIWAMVACCHSK